MTCWLRRLVSPELDRLASQGMVRGLSISSARPALPPKVAVAASYAVPFYP